MTDFMLSLSTNPYDPWDEYGLWSNFDRHEGFDTAGFLARCLVTSEILSEPDQEADVEATIDHIMNNPSFKGLYKKLSRDSTTT